MIVCRQCGHQNEEGVSFCGSCGTFLEWTGERVEEAEPEPPPPAPVTERPGLVERVKQAVGLDSEASERVEPVAPVPEPTPVVPAATQDASPTAPQRAAPPPPAEVADQAPDREAPPPADRPPPQVPAEMVAPVAVPPPVPPVTRPPARPPGRSRVAPPITEAAADQPAARRPEAVVPAHERPRAVPPGPPPPRFKPGDLICGQCGRGNDPSRRFCSQCGNSLATAVVARVPWYQRLFRRQPKAYAAGERPGTMRPGTERGAARRRPGFGRTLRNVVLIALALGVLAYMLVPGVRDGVNGAIAGVRRIVAPELVASNPISAQASAELPGHEALLSIDGKSNTYWSADLASAPLPNLILGFERPVDLSRVLITSGASDDFEAQPRPRDVRLTFSDGSTSELSLRDEIEPQSYEIDARQVTSVVFEILSVYGGLQGNAVSVTELEFFTPE